MGLNRRRRSTILVSPQLPLLWPSARRMTMAPVNTILLPSGRVPYNAPLRELQAKYRIPIMSPWTTTLSMVRWTSARPAITLLARRLYPSRPGPMPGDGPVGSYSGQGFSPPLGPLLAAHFEIVPDTDARPTHCQVPRPAVYPDRAALAAPRPLGTGCAVPAGYALARIGMPAAGMASIQESLCGQASARAQKSRKNPTSPGFCSNFALARQP